LPIFPIFSSYYTVYQQVKILTRRATVKDQSNQEISRTNSHNIKEGEIFKLKESDCKGLFTSECSGSVVNYKTGELVEFVRVELNNNLWEYNENTDTTGTFTFKELRSGTYRINASLIGYHPFSDTVKIQPGKKYEYQIKIISE